MCPLCLCAGKIRHKVFQNNKFFKSTFPPEIIIPTFLFLNRSLSRSRAAKATALLGSTIIFIRSQMSFIAAMISVSSTRIISETNFFIIGKWSAEFPGRECQRSVRGDSRRRYRFEKCETPTRTALPWIWTGTRRPGRSVFCPAPHRFSNQSEQP